MEKDIKELKKHAEALRMRRDKLTVKIEELTGEYRKERNSLTRQINIIESEYKRMIKARIIKLDKEKNKLKAEL